MGGNATRTNNFLAMVTDKLVKYLHKQSGSCQPRKTLNHESCGWMNGQYGKVYIRLTKNLLSPRCVQPNEQFPGDVNHGKP